MGGASRAHDGAPLIPVHDDAELTLLITSNFSMNCLASETCPLNMYFGKVPLGEVHSQVPNTPGVPGLLRHPFFLGWTQRVVRPHVLQSSPGSGLPPEFLFCLHFTLPFWRLRRWKSRVSRPPYAWKAQLLEVSVAVG